MRPANYITSLGNREVWSIDPWLPIKRTSMTDQTGRMLRLILFLSGCTDHSVNLNRSTTKPTVRSAKTQISLGIHKSDQFSLCHPCVPKDPRFLPADSEDSDQTGRIIEYTSTRIIYFMFWSNKFPDNQLLWSTHLMIWRMHQICYLNQIKCYADQILYSMPSIICRLHPVQWHQCLTSYKFDPIKYEIGLIMRCFDQIRWSLNRLLYSVQNASNTMLF